MIKAVLRLRRDNYFNYDKIKDSFVPANGEICLVDTAKDGLRAVCGDGVTPFGRLNFMGDLGDFEVGFELLVILAYESSLTLLSDTIHL